jgi:hypothetical protein
MLSHRITIMGGVGAWLLLLKGCTRGSCESTSPSSIPPRNSALDSRLARRSSPFGARYPVTCCIPWGFRSADCVLDVNGGKASTMREMCCVSRFPTVGHQAQAPVAAIVRAFHATQRDAWTIESALHESGGAQKRVMRTLLNRFKGNDRGCTRDACCDSWRTTRPTRQRHGKSGMSTLSDYRKRWSTCGVVYDAFSANCSAHALRALRYRC